MSQIEIDSFKLRIPVSSVEILDDSIKANWILVNEETGMIDGADFKRNGTRFNIDGIKTYFALERQMLKKSGSEEFLIILINSKILRRNYFSGITKKNIKTVYKYLISLQVVDFTFEDFLNGNVTDCDFKKDGNFERDFFKKMISDFVYMAKPQKDLGNGCKPFTHGNHLGIQFSRRENTAITTGPFIKFYHKGIEITKGNNDNKLFYAKYLKEKKNIDEILTNRIRCEFTIKNKKHFKMFEVEHTSLKSVLDITQDTKQFMLNSILNAHLNFPNAEGVYISDRERKLNNVKPTETLIIYLLDRVLKESFNLELILNDALKDLNKIQKYRVAKRVRELSKLYLFTKNDYENNSKTLNNFMKWVLQ